MYDENDSMPIDADEVAGLPRRREPGRLLEERTVRALRNRGLLRPARPQRAWWAAAAAAALALFATGYAVGQRSAGLAFLEAAGSDRQAAMEAALRVQRTGSAWIAALGALGGQSDESDPEALRQGREAARVSLHAAALEFAALSPGDPLAARLLWLLSDEPPDDRDAERSQAVIWF